MRITWRLAVTTAALAAAYYLLVWVIMERLPWVLVPPWWWHAWPSRHAALFTWFQALCVGGSLAAALPISVVIALFVKQHQFAVTLAAAAITAFLVTLGAVVAYPPMSSAVGTDVWLADLIYLFALCGSPPLLVCLSRLLPSNNRWRGP